MNFYFIAIIWNFFVPFSWKLSIFKNFINRSTWRHSMAKRTTRHSAGQVYLSGLTSSLQLRGTSGSSKSWSESRYCMISGSIWMSHRCSCLPHLLCHLATITSTENSFCCTEMSTMPMVWWCNGQLIKLSKQEGNCHSSFRAVLS